MSVERIPVSYRRPPQITPREIWDSPEPSDFMVWEVCPYAKGHMKFIDEGCQQCPSFEEDERHGSVKRGCRAWAEETCRLMMAIQRREAA